MSSTTKSDKRIVVSSYSTDPLQAYERLYVSQHVAKVTPLDPATPICKDKIRFVCLSDTHSMIEDRPQWVPAGDVLIHAGDITPIGMPRDVDAFNTFLGTLPHKVKIVIAGNHDISFDSDIMQKPRNYAWHIRKTRSYLSKRNLTSVKQLLTNCVYLEDSATAVCGIKLYGAPWVPKHCNMGFNLQRGQPILEKWNQIPSDIDILITHCPPLGRGDLCVSHTRAGCVELLNTVQKRVKPKYHVFGHIHEGYGVTSDGQTIFINASNSTVQYVCSNPPIVFDLPIPPGHGKRELVAVNSHHMNLVQS